MSCVESPITSSMRPTDSPSRSRTSQPASIRYHETGVSPVATRQTDRPPTYLRATVLDDFVDDAWAVGQPRPSDSLEPARFGGMYQPGTFGPMGSQRGGADTAALFARF